MRRGQLRTTSACGRPLADVPNFGSPFDLEPPADFVKKSTNPPAAVDTARFCAIDCPVCRALGTYFLAQKCPRISPRKPLRCNVLRVGCEIFGPAWP